MGIREFKSRTTARPKYSDSIGKKGQLIVLQDLDSVLVFK